ncbi:MAG: HEPN domain-containing protein [Bryobacteraceae bacterium]
MKSVDLIRHRDSIRSAMGRAKDLGWDPELLGHWGRYLCILAAGFLENTIRILYSSHVERQASPSIATYVVAQLERIQNPKAGKFIEVAHTFDKKWADDLEAFLNVDDGRRKNAIDSIMNNRNLIAHGRSSNISVVQVREYFASASEGADYLESQLAP